MVDALVAKTFNSKTKSILISFSCVVCDMFNL